MTTTRTDIAAIQRIERGHEADHLAQAAYDRLIALLETLSADDWRRPTDCPAWTVHEMVAHVVGAARGHASPLEFMRQAAHGSRHKSDFDGNDTDAMNAYQVQRNAHLSPSELVSALRDVAPRAVRGRRRIPTPLRRRPVPIAQSGSFPAGTPRLVSMGELLDVVLTRDVWLHRIDIYRAVDRQPELDPAFDGRIVADIVADWAASHSQPVQLELTGPAGSSFVQDTGGPVLQLGAIEFCRILSGRADGAGLLRTKVLF